MNNKEQIYEDIIETFVDKKRQLVAQLEIEIGKIEKMNMIEISLLSNKNGLLQFNSQKWSYKKHGIGYRFENTINGEIVEVGNLLMSFDEIDFFHFEEYLESLNMQDIHLVLEYAKMNYG